MNLNEKTIFIWKIKSINFQYSKLLEPAEISDKNQDNL